MGMLFVQPKANLCLSVHVNDFRMAGRKENLGPMWDVLRRSLSFEDDVEFVQNT